jgi:hypothetical protein
MTIPQLVYPADAGAESPLPLKIPNARLEAVLFHGEDTATLSMRTRTNLIARGRRLNSTTEKS